MSTSSQIPTRDEGVWVWDDAVATSPDHEELSSCATVRVHMGDIKEERPLEEQMESVGADSKFNNNHDKKRQSKDTRVGNHVRAKKKRMKVTRVNGALLCLPLRNADKLKHLSYLDAAKELARCMHESKYNLLRNTIHQLGLEKTVQLFHETSQIQEEGGIVSCEGKKKAPGGVFFALLKKCASTEQLQDIFRYEKGCRKKRAKAKRLMTLAAPVDSCIPPASKRESVFSRLGNRQQTTPVVLAAEQTGFEGNELENEELAMEVSEEEEDGEVVEEKNALQEFEGTNAADFNILISLD